MDFAQGYKTIAGAIIFVLAYFGAQLSQETVLATVTSIGQAIGACVAAYGLIMKLWRNYKETTNPYNQQ